ncbi:MAG: TonB-dependent receptor [Pseudomonadota bacterium]
MRFSKQLCFASVAAMALASPAQAQDDDISISESFFVIGSAGDALYAPGSATVLESDYLNRFEYSDISRVLRAVPGVYIQEEDGFGLRPNIGLRGTGTARSEKITLLEDGVLIAPAPYSAPAAYYFPTAARMSAVEVLKGPSAILEGPRTVGGAINMVSTQIPDSPSGQLEARVGSRGFYEVHGFGGGMKGNVGALAEVYRSGSNGFKNLPNDGDTGFEIEDYVLKLRAQTREDASYPQTFEFKGQYYSQSSNETYLGLTDQDFAADPFQRYAASQNDRFDSEHYQLQLSHQIEIGEVTTVDTQIYYNDFQRNWFKVDDLNFGDGRIRPSALFGSGVSNDDVRLQILRGEADSIDDAIQLRNNNRDYYAWGIQSTLRTEFETGSWYHAVEFGVRYHEDEEDRLQNRENFAMRNGALVATSIGTPGSQANRVQSASAWAIYARDTIYIGENLTIEPGIRAEFIDLERQDFAGDDTSRANGPTRIRSNTVTAIAPGVGFTYQLNDALLLLGGVHRGINPPGASDASAQEETSLNSEFGARFITIFATVEAIAFYSKYNNILGNCTNSVGCTAGETGDQFNGGDARVFGLELSGYTEPYITDGLRLPLRFAYTFTDAQFTETFEDSFFGDVQDGDNLDFTPRHTLFLSAGVAGDTWSTALNMTHVSKQRTAAGQGPIPQDERINGYTVFDLAGNYQVAKPLNLFLTVQNLFGNDYAVSRLPYGLRPGRPRSVIGGVRVTF